MPFQNQEAKTENPKTKNEKLKKALNRYIGVIFVRLLVFFLPI